MQSFVRSDFHKGFSESNFISRYFYAYSKPIIDSVNAKDGKFDITDVQEMNMSGTIRETEEDLAYFQKIVSDYEAECKAKGEEPDYSSVLRSAVISVIWKDGLFCVVNCLSADLLAIFYSWYITFMIRYIKDPNRETSEGLKMIFIFIAA